jgi:hypothetical protein
METCAHLASKEELRRFVIGAENRFPPMFCSALTVGENSRRLLCQVQKKQSAYGSALDVAEKSRVM